MIIKLKGNKKKSLKELHTFKLFVGNNEFLYYKIKEEF